MAAAGLSFPKRLIDSAKSADDSRAPDPERAQLGREIGEAISDGLSCLPARRHAAVALYLEGRSVPEASRLLGWGPKRVENLAYRGLAQLRTELAKRGLAGCPNTA